MSLIVFLGVYPKPVLERIEPAVDRLLTHVEGNVEDFERPEPAAPVQRAGVEQLTTALESGSHESETEESGESHEGED